MERDILWVTITCLLVVAASLWLTSVAAALCLWSASRP